MQSRPSRRRSAVIVGVIALGLILWQRLEAPGAGGDGAQERRSETISQEHADQPLTPRAKPEQPPEAAPDALQLPPRRAVEQVRILDQRGEVVYRGRVELQATLERIVSGGHYPHRNDGAVFQNRPPPGEREPALPRQAPGYYREYVHPTPGVQGPGPQRIVVGRDGEFYYTPDHYQTFIPLQ